MDKYHLDVPFFITTDQISNPTLGLKSIKHIAQTTDDKLLIELFQTSFDETDVNRIQAFVNLPQMSDSVEDTVKVKRKEYSCSKVVMLKYHTKLIFEIFPKHSQ